MASRKTRGISTLLGPGAFVAFVGGSGVGKDSILGYARQRSEDTLFVKRAVTRPTGLGEDCDELTEAELEALDAIGRADPEPETSADLEIINDGTISEAGEQLLLFIRALERN